MDFVDADIAVEQADNKGNNNYQSMPQPRPESGLITGMDVLSPPFIARRAPHENQRPPAVTESLLSQSSNWLSSPRIQRDNLSTFPCLCKAFIRFDVCFTFMVVSFALGPI